VTIDELFLLTLQDLEKRVPLGRGEYDALMTAGLLRKLLLDEQPLIDLANRPPTRRMRIRYEIVDQQPPPGAHGWVPNGNLHPGAPTGGSMVSLSRDAFLARPVLVAFGETISVRELIKFMANIQGAVHVTRPSSPKDEALWEFAWGTRFILPHAQYSGGIHDLVGIGKIVLDAVTALPEVVARETWSPRMPDFATGQGRVDDATTRGW
jgi:hypothetical protein